jgi:hypothetical protein
VIRLEPWAAATVAATVCFVISGLWYSPLLFGRVMLTELGRTDQPSRATGTLLAVPASIAAALGLGSLTASAEAADVLHALVIAAIIWGAFVVGIELPALSLDRAPRVFAIRAGHKLVVLLGMALVYGLWT